MLRILLFIFKNIRRSIIFDCLFLLPADRQPQTLNTRSANASEAGVDSTSRARRATYKYVDSWSVSKKTWFAIRGHAVGGIRPRGVLYALNECATVYVIIVRKVHVTHNKFIIFSVTVFIFFVSVLFQFFFSKFSSFSFSCR